MAKSTSLGHFLTFDLWKEAIRLLDFQVASKQKNRHFASFSNFYYERLGRSVDHLKVEEYFDQIIGNNLFYGLQREFEILPYVLPKAGLGLRNYKFLTYPLRTLYYTIGLYLLKVSQDYLLDYYYKQSRIKSYYGGHLKFVGETLTVNSRTIYYMDFYKKFKSDARRQLQGNDVEDRVIVHIDIQNYFDSILISRLLEKIHEHSKETIQKVLKYDPITNEQITSFFKYLMGNENGIPQADNDLISSFIGFLYLTFADLLIEDEITSLPDVANHEIIRYMDDIVLSITFQPHVPQRIRESTIESIASKIADQLFYELGLKLNNKTRMYWLANPVDREEFQKTLKKVSPQYYLADDGDEQPQNKLNNILDELQNLKNSSATVNFQHDLQDEILKDVLDPRVRQLIQKPQNLKRINKIFVDFNYSLVRVAPLPIMIILLHDKAAKDAFIVHLTLKKPLNTSDMNLMLTYLCQTDFIDNQLLKTLEQFEPMKDIVRKFHEASLSYDYPGYFELSRNHVLVLKDAGYVIDQIRLRVISEKENLFSVALNHLLNEIHAVCFQCDSNRKDHIKLYNAESVENFLRSQGITHNNRTAIRKLFDRRNANQVSHPGAEQSVTWGVTKDEYYKYKEMVGKTLEQLLSKMI